MKTIGKLLLGCLSAAALFYAGLRYERQRADVGATCADYCHYVWHWYAGHPGAT